MDELINGINATTGQYLTLPTKTELLQHSQGKPPLDPRALREYRWWVERHGIDDPTRAPVQGVDPRKLEESGWGVIFGEDVDPKVRQALKALLARRQDQAGSRFRGDYIVGPTTKKGEFLALHNAGPGPADPRKVPYYLLIVGSPESIPFRFQYELDVQYAVGRIHFDTLDGYENYAKGVVAAETGSPRTRELTFFGVRNDDDPGTEATAEDLIEPLTKALAEEVPGWPVKKVLRQEAEKSRLRRLLGGDETPPFLFTAGHGMAFPPDHALLREHQGALLCQEWPGPEKWKGPIPKDWYFSADDVPDDANLLGLISLFFACYSAGTPKLGDFDNPVFGQQEPVSETSFLSRLAQRLLGHPNGGALAVLGHVDRAWTTSFNWIQEKQTRERPVDPGSERNSARRGQIETFESVIKQLLEGHPVGSAMEYINQRHAELSVELSGLWADREYLLNPGDSTFSRMWRANNDARNFVVLGDPAVRLVWPE